jgi:hypothetical protein
VHLPFVTSRRGTVPGTGLFGGASCVHLPVRPSFVTSCRVTVPCPVRAFSTALVCARPFTSCRDIVPHPVGGSASWVRSPFVTSIVTPYRTQPVVPHVCSPVCLPLVMSRCGTVPCPVGPFRRCLVCVFACAPALGHVASWHRTMADRGALRQRLMVLTFPCAVLRHHLVLAPAPAKSTASVELASVVEEVTMAKPEAFVHCAGRRENAPPRPTREASSCPRLRL